MNKHFDIIIVGAGLVGIILAHALRHHGFSIALIDAKPLTTESSQDGRSLALNYASQKMLATLQLWDAIAPFATPIETVEVSRQGVFSKTYLRARSLALQALGYVVPAAVLGSQMAKALLSADNITFYTPAHIKEVTMQIAAAEVVLHYEGQMHTLSTRLLIAADGTQSTLAKWLHIQQAQHMYHQTAIVSAVRVSTPHHSCAYERFTQNGVIALLPVRQQEYGVVWTVNHSEAEALLSLPPAVFLAKLQDEMGHYWGKEKTLGAVSSYPLVSSSAYETIRPRFVLLGNAAHTLHPIAAQGLNLALQSVACLAEILTEAKTDIGDVSVLRRFQEKIQKQQARMQSITHTIAGFSHIISANTLCHNIIWHAGLGLLNKLSPIKHQFMRHTAGLGLKTKLLCGVPLR